MIYAILGGLIGFVAGSIAGAVVTPKRGVDLLENARSKFRRARAEADSAAASAEQTVKENFEQATRD